VSVEAISWALNLAPVPPGRGGQPSSACKFVLVGLANHAGPDGTGAFPSVATLVRYTGLSERTVRTCLDRLEAGGIISPCDPGVVAARIKRAGRRPQGWDLNLSLARDDMGGARPRRTRAPVRRAGHQARRGRAAGRWRPGWRGAIAAPRLPPAARLWITGPTGCSRCAPSRERGATSAPTGCNWRRYGVQQLHPNRTRNHPGNPPSQRARRRRRPRRLAAVGRSVSSSPRWVLTGS
jgi:hypothetical protein